MLLPSITKGRAINSIKGIVIKDRPADIVVKEIDKATFPFNIFVI